MVDLKAQLEAHISGAGADSIQQEVIREHREWLRSEDAQAGHAASQALAQEQHEAQKTEHAEIVAANQKAVDEAKGLPPQGDLRDALLKDALGQ